MKIKKMTVYGFGKHENLSIDVNQALAVFYGRNEAGKTTLQQFIVQILFGFPSRSHSGNRYEPKNGGKYGGQLHVVDEQFGSLVIERVKGKAAGDVTVYFEDGSRGAETELKKILREYDRASFESIFSFSIHELQHLDKMTEEQLSRTLLASGTTGVDAITQLEAELEKEMANLFKKGGRNPQLNQLMEELRNDEKELKHHREQADLYGPFAERLTAVNVQLEETAEAEAEISRKLSEAAKQQQAAPLTQKKKILEEQLRTISVNAFPAEGSRRMDGLSDRISESTAKKNHLNNELAVLPLPVEIGAVEESLSELLDKESEWLRFQSKNRELKEEAERLKEELDRSLGLIGKPLAEASKFDVSLVNEEKLLMLAEEANREEENGRFRERQLQDEKRKLIDAEKEMSVLERMAPAQQQLKDVAEWSAVASKLAEAKAMQRMGRKADNSLLYYLLIALGIAGIVAGVMRGDGLIVFLAAGAAAVGAWMLWQNRGKSDHFEDTDDIIRRFGGREAELDSLQQKIAEYNRKVENTLQTISRCDEKIEDLKNELRQRPAQKDFEFHLDQMGMDTSAGKSTVIEMFRTIRKVQEIEAKLKRTSEALAAAGSEEAEWLEKAAATAGRAVSSDDLYATLRAQAKQMNEEKEQNKRLQEKRQTLTSDIARQTSLVKELESEKQQLLDDSGATDIDQFYQMHIDWNRKRELLQEFELVSSQLEAIGLSQEQDENPVYPADARITELEQQNSQLKDFRNQLIDERAELQQQLNHLLTDDAYELKLQNFEEKKAQFNELAHRWSVNKAVTEAIRQTMAELKEKSLPAVLSQACIFFQRLTGNAYSSMEIHPDGHFEAIRSDNQRFRIVELSQATKEQAYLALRLSLAVSMQKSHPFPIIMDDPFVHFDRLRLQQVINLIKELQRDHQFIYFTCHEEMCVAWPSAQIIDVANTGRSVYL